MSFLDEYTDSRVLDEGGDKSSTMVGHLVENAIDFLERSAEDLEERPKYSIIHFYSAVELFLKARLMLEHWTLVVENVNNADWAKFVDGDFRSVNLDEAHRRLKKIVRSGLSQDEIALFRDLRTYRNQTVHFFHQAHTVRSNDEFVSSIAKNHLRAWYTLHKLLREKWAEQFEEWSQKIEELHKSLKKYRDFLEAAYADLLPEIDRLREAGVEITACPSCEFDARKEREIADPEITFFTCLLCKLKSAAVKIACECGAKVHFDREGFGSCDSCKNSWEPRDLAEELYDWERASCADCEAWDCVINRPNEAFFCTSCFGRFESLWQCAWCGESNAGGQGGADSFLIGCSLCDGRLA